MDATDLLENKEMSESGEHEDSAVDERTSETVCEEDKSAAAAKGMSPRGASGSKSSDGAEEVEGEVSPVKSDPGKSMSPASQSITMVISPTTSGGQKSQTLRIVSQEQATSAPIHTIQLPLKSSPIVLKATTIPMPTKTVSIVAKHSVKSSPTVVMPSTSKMPSKTLGIRKGLFGVDKRESASSSSKSESALHQKVKLGGVTKAKMQSARVIVVPLQITKEMIAAKQKAAKLAKSGGSGDAGKKPTENVDETNEVSGDKGKNPAKQAKKSTAVKKTDADDSWEKVSPDSKPPLKTYGRESKKSGADEIGNEPEDVDSEITSRDKLTEKNKVDKEKMGETEKLGNKTGSKTKKEAEEKELSRDEDNEISKGRKIIKGKTLKKGKDSDDMEDAELKSKESPTKEEKSGDDSECDVGKGRTPKKTKKKDTDGEDGTDSESPPKSKAKIKAAKKSTGKTESDGEDNDTGKTEADQDEDDLEVKPARKKRAKKVEEEKEEDAERELEEDVRETKKPVGRQRKPKAEPTPAANPPEEQSLSSRRSRRESNLSMKLAEWGLVPVATPKASHVKPIVAPKSPIASRTPAAAKPSAAAKSSVASRSPAAAVDSPVISSDDVSPPSSPEKPSSGVTVTVIKSGSGLDSTPAAAASGTTSESNKTSGTTQGSDVAEKPPAKSNVEQLDKASGNLGSSSVAKVVPKVIPKAVKTEKSTPAQPAKQQVAKAEKEKEKEKEKVAVSRPAIPLKQIQNKSLMCKPIMMTKATSCNPIRIHKVTQTEAFEAGRKKKTLFVPVPVPIALPSPVATCALPTPFPLPLPVPLPVPCFIPTSRKSIDGLMKSLQELHDQLPSDPFEVDLLTMADAVATAHHEVPDCIIEPEEIKPIMKADPSIGVAVTTMQHQTRGGELSEDVLEMALRMAQEMPEEGSIELEALKERMANRPDASQTTEFGYIHRNGGVQHRRTAGGDGDRGPYKKARLDGGEGGLGMSASNAVAFAKGLPMKDQHMKLKYSCGVRAWKHWVKEKNVELEKAAAALKVRSKLFKYEILQCSAEELNLALSLFVREVRKPTGEDYAPDTIYYLCLGIQYYLYENGRVGNIFSDASYKGFSDTLNNLLSTFQIRLDAQGIIICRVTEEHLWECRQLGAHSPYVLLSTLVYLNTKYFMLNSTDAHLALTFTNVVKQFKKNGVSADAKQAQTAFLRYNATVFTDASRQKGVEAPVNPLEQLENHEDPLRCPVKLYEFYLSKCPENIRSRSELFYLTPETSCLPDSPVWYSTAPVGSEVMSKMLSRFQVIQEIQEAFLHNMQPVFG